MPRSYNPLSGFIEDRGLNWVSKTSDPTTSDRQLPPTIWINSSTSDVFMQVAAGGATPDWVTLTNSGGTMTDLDADTGTATPVAGVITIAGGVGCSTSATGNTLTITASGGGLDWTRIAGTTQTLAVSNGYTNANAALTTFTLPATSAVGDIIKIDGEGASLFKIAQGASQQIRMGPLTSTVGAGGYALSSKIYDCVTLRCQVADTIWQIESSIGNIGLL